MKITAHVLVKNEENFIWYAINSILSYVDKVMVWDTGSSDNTIEIIQSINNSKISFQKKGSVGKYQFAELRQEMINQTDGGWIFVLDGDEVWPEDSISEIISLIEKYGDSINVIVSPVKMLIGDIYHYQEEKAGKYKIKNKTGHYNIRAIKNFKGLKVKGFYGNEGYMNSLGVDLQNLPDERIVFAEKPYLHASHLKRSSVKNSKYKYEIGKDIPLDYYYPEVFFRERPCLVPSIFQSTDLPYRLRAFIETPLKKIKRRIV